MGRGGEGQALNQKTLLSREYYYICVCIEINREKFFTQFLKAKLDIKKKKKNQHTPQFSEKAVSFKQKSLFLVGNVQYLLHGVMTGVLNALRFSLDLSLTCCLSFQYMPATTAMQGAYIPQYTHVQTAAVPVEVSI